MEENQRTLDNLAAVDKEYLHRLNLRMEALARNSQYVVKDANFPHYRIQTTQ